MLPIGDTTGGTHDEDEPHAPGRAEEDTVLVEPTALYRVETAPPAVSAATAPAPDGNALLVFRSPEDAEAFRAGSGKHPAAEGWRPLSVEGGLLAGLLELHGCTHVAMPHEWTGTGGSDLFTAAKFLRLLEEAPPA